MDSAASLITLLQHHLWANLRLLKICADLDQARQSASIAGAYGSIRETLEHLVLSEQSYFSRIRSGQLYQRPEESGPMSWNEMLETAEETGKGLIEWAPRIQAQDTVQLNWRGVPRDVPKVIILAQAISHGSEHRNQVLAILTQLGLEPPDLQAWVYFDEVDR